MLKFTYYNFFLTINLALALHIPSPPIASNTLASHPSISNKLSLIQPSPTALHLVLPRETNGLASLVLGHLSNYQVTKTYSPIPELGSKTIEVPDGLATVFPAEGIDLLLGLDLFKELNSTFHTTCERKISPECQQQLKNILEREDGVALQARGLESLAYVGAALALYFSYLFMRLTSQSETVVSVPVVPLLGMHMPQSDHAQIASWDSPATTVFATTSGDVAAVTITSTPTPTPVGEFEPPTFERRPNGDVDVTLSVGIVDALSRIMDDVICARDLESQEETCIKRATITILGRIIPWEQLWRSILILGEFEIPAPAPRMQAMIDAVVEWGRTLQPPVDPETLRKIVPSILLISNNRYKAKAIQKFKLSQKELNSEDKTEEEEEKKSQCGPPESTPFCQNCGGNGDRTVNKCPGDPAKDMVEKGCDCFPSANVQPYNYFGSDAGLVQATLNLRLLQDNPRTTSPTSEVQCYTDAGKDYFDQHMKLGGPVENFCPSNGDSLSGIYSIATSDTGVCKQGDLEPDFCKYVPVRGGRVIPPDAPPECDAVGQFRDNICKAAVKQIFEACPDGGGVVNNMCGRWSIGLCLGTGEDCEKQLAAKTFLLPATFIRKKVGNL
ncbi:hypothetical protein GLAREA_10289 [Glarea lozoyensis ATCC 20868]|uniref:Uncharacterized protein n=1 Tax=Glarea lozoyensis (strain ATCC 20868 / MF5171) TaxID=1116229 RepID=S3DA12_GLAL2|nr:uncharacterized protein GLAREA_10289 [Glarea lozoyensis ATCC 20868]EPE34595.1 hypothetical protein GLAREA_10289 [Glarea lozoyensis ATCC 20868]